MHLLLLEDKVDLAIAIQKALRPQKYVVDWAQDGEEAWEYLQQPDVYTLGIFDWMVRKVSGLGLCQRFRSQHSQLPVLMLTHDRIRSRLWHLADESVSNVVANSPSLPGLRILSGTEVKQFITGNTRYFN
jgi:DNA-binding response OmpR family regulator